MGLLVTGTNKLISLLGAGLSALFALLPNSPFTWDISGVDSTFMRLVFWIIPVPQILASLEAYVLAVGLYYAIRTALRWVKVVDG